MSDKTLIEWNADVGTRFLTIHPDGSFDIDKDAPPLFVIGELAKAFIRQQDRIKRLYDGILKQNQEIEQTCGKVLGYPWFKDDQKNFPGATEKDGVCVGDHVAATIVSELAKRHTEALARIKRLEEAGDTMANAYRQICYDAYDDQQVDNWFKAKEAKP